MSLDRIGKICARMIFIVLGGLLLTGCATVEPDKLDLALLQEPKAKEVMERKGNLVHLSTDAEHQKPVLVLLHGATDDPSEMMEIARQWRQEYDVFLFSYNYHQPIQKVASDFTREIERLKAENRLSERVTVVTYSYSAIVFREAVITAKDRTLFCGDSLIQLVPTAGGSRLAWAMQYCPFELFMGMFSSMSVAEDPYGRLAKRLWEGEGNVKFYDVIKPTRMQTILVEGDTHSLARVRNKKVQTRYKNGIGENVTIIPKGAGVVHDYFPTEPVALEYLRKALEWPFAGTDRAGKPEVNRSNDLALGTRLSTHN